MIDSPKAMPIQATTKRREKATIPTAVYMRAYDVYSHVYGPQVSLITGECRGGFGLGELAAFLYAHSFPVSEWKSRVEEAFNGMNLD